MLITLYFITHKNPLPRFVKTVLKLHQNSPPLFFFSSLSLWTKVTKTKGALKWSCWRTWVKQFPKMLLWSTPLTPSCQLRYSVFSDYTVSFTYVSRTISLPHYLSLLFSLWIFWFLIFNKYTSLHSLMFFLTDVFSLVMRKNNLEKNLEWKKKRERKEY